MAGLIILFILGSWAFVTAKITKFIILKIGLEQKEDVSKTSSLEILFRLVAFLVVYTLVFISPVADEVIGKEQMEFLYCNTENMLIYDEDKVRGKSLQYKFVPRKKINKILVIKEISSEWVDPKTGEVFITRRMYYARGGWLSKLISAGKPLTFSDHCSPKGYYELFKKLDVKKLDGRYGED